jgi:TonB family protein
MEQKLNFFTISFAFLISIILHLFVLLSFNNFTFIFTEKLKNQITINLSAIGEIERNIKKESIQKEKILPKEIPKIKKIKKRPKKKIEKKIDVKKIIPQKKSIEQKKSKEEIVGGTLKGIEGGTSKGIISQYVTQIYKLIDSKKNYPRQSLIRKEEGVVLLQIIIRNDGKLMSIKSLKAKHQRLVDSSFSAVEDARPFPPFPLEILRKKMIIEIPLIYKIR